MVDDLIKAAFEHEADRAPGTERIRAALAAPRRRSPARWLLPVAAAAVTAALVVGTQFTQSDPTPPVAATTTPVDLGRPAPQRVSVPLPARPAALPDGFVEVRRTVVTQFGDTAWIRYFERGDQGITVQGGSLPRTAVLRTPLSGDVYPGDDQGSVVYEDPASPEKPRVSVSGNVPDNVPLAQHLGDSLAPDLTAALTVPVEFGYLPLWFQDRGYATLTVEGSDCSASLAATAQAPGSTQPTTVTADLATTPPTTPDTTPAVVIPLSDGRTLRIRTSAPLDDLQEIADAVRVAPRPSCDWYGR
ncbi:hypothetical protein [Actinokineospora bangkokensis]|uniref:Uncharacterized protein n=1 Tax=Actinokineospora bangkokensis TaxID=1193682 RepID=A0A1Q9LTP2_9PSEU|nr:hypothetical protein [Actinokineospora bangkokensis]OLR95371.1 hypothetical protein BJP25_06335 [Actinokineospora bangkokensis]